MEEIMKIKDKYKELKYLNFNKVILIKSGNFYISYDEDAIVLNHLFSYQIVNNKIGFPLVTLPKIKEKLDELNVDYIIYNNEEEITTQTNEDNNYMNIYNKAKKEEFTTKVNEVLIDRIRFLLKDPNNYEKIKRFIDEF